MKFSTYNPATGEKLRDYNVDDLKKAEKKLKNSKEAFERWSKLDLQKRLNAIKKVSQELLKNKERYAKVMTLEMGKPIKESVAEIEKCAWLCDYYFENSQKFLEDELIETEAKKSFVSFEPLGVIFCIMPWNFPFWQVFRFAIPALIVGNCVLLKHSRSTLGCSVEIENVFRKFLPKNVFQNVICESETAEKLIEGVDGVSFTGSSEVGSRIASLAAQNLKKFVLELGGSDPFIILKDADIDLAIDGAIKGRFLNAGQSCIASKRFIVHKKVINEFTDKATKKISEMKLGNPLDENNSIGPLASANQLEKLERQIAESVAKGAKVLSGGKREGEKGFFFSPTIVSEVKKGMPLHDEEVFGPVLPIISARNDKEAIEVANDTEYGLGASVWTRDLVLGEKLARKIESGFVSINEIVKSDPRLPFGGIKKSGIGRELSRYGMLEFCNIKTITVFEK